MKLPNIDYSFIASQGSDWVVDRETGRITVQAPARSDIFIDPNHDNPADPGANRHDAATLMMRVPKGDFQFRATVDVRFAATFDAGVLLLRIDERTWAKLCFEFSPDREPMVVSVVTKGGTSDDANAFVVNGRQVHLRASRKGNVYALHASTDGVKWQFVRMFAFDNRDADPEVGFEAQAPFAESCEVCFSNYSFSPTTLDDFRSGQ